MLCMNTTNFLKVNGLSRKRNYHGRWEILIKKCTECFNTILDLAAKRRRNYILDQVIEKTFLDKLSGIHVEIRQSDLFRYETRFF